jgi:hypothetical protein
MKRLITALAAIVALASQALAEDTQPAPCSTGLPIMST